MLTTQQIKETVRGYFKDKPVKKVYLFGSYARGEADESSDVDLLIDLDMEKWPGWSLFSWEDEIQGLVKRKTEIVANATKPEETSNWRFIEQINKEKVLLCEK